VGEPINPKPWLWYFEVIGGGRLPTVVTWWETKTGGIMITAVDIASGGRSDPSGMEPPASAVITLDSCATPAIATSQ
jgi:acetyl-CoA synthetase